MGKKLPLSRQFQLNNGHFFRAQYKYIQNLQTLQGYIFGILQHFATKLCFSTNFRILSLAVVKDYFRSSYLVRNIVYYANWLMGNLELLLINLTKTQYTHDEEGQHFCINFNQH